MSAAVSCLVGVAGKVGQGSLLCKRLWLSGVASFLVSVLCVIVSVSYRLVSYAEPASNFAVSASVIKSFR